MSLAFDKSTVVKEYKDDSGNKYAVDWRSATDTALEDLSYKTSFTFNAHNQNLTQTQVKPLMKGTFYCIFINF
ncbi:MAG: hypothetical protein COB99_06380 [Sulfurimonas sp.]|nr:MAG: hypothetical protein COB99_06380 [Sulfurimonas sp.]